MDYFLKANGLIILWIVFYFIFLKNETFYQSIRLYFLTGLLFILAIPFIEIPIYVEKTVSKINYAIIEGPTISNTPIEQPFDWIQVVTAVYLVGVVFFTLKFIIQLFSLGNLISKYKTIHEGKYKLIETEEQISPFSFFNYIIYNKNQFNKKELSQIIIHEKAHANQWHSTDTLLLYILQIAFWINPFVWLYKKAIQQNLEFLADASVCNQITNIKQYQFTLLKASKTNYCETITNNFYNSLIKKRILMLNKEKSHQKWQWKFTLMLPLLATFLFIFSTKVEAINEVPSFIQNINNDYIEVITKNFKKSDLKSLQIRLKKEGIEMNYKDLKYNSQNEIIQISISIKKGKRKSYASWNGDKHIPYIKVGVSNGNIICSSSYDDFKKKSIIEIREDTTVYDVETDKEVLEESNEKSKWKVSSGRNNVAFATKDTLYISGNKNSMLSDLDYSNGDPLYIIDDIESTKEAFENLTPQHINSMAVIKGSGTAAYGNKGKHGVIMVTTNNSKNLKPTVQLSNSALYIIDGKESSKSVSEKLNPDDIKSMNVLKGKKAKEKYGDKGKNGVIEITLKDKKTIKIKDVSHKNGKKPIYVIDNKIVSEEKFKKINTDDIKAMYVLKDKKAVDKYGEKGKNGVIEITLKK